MKHLSMNERNALAGASAGHLIYRPNQNDYFSTSRRTAVNLAVAHWLIRKGFLVPAHKTAVARYTISDAGHAALDSQPAPRPQDYQIVAFPLLLVMSNYLGVISLWINLLGLRAPDVPPFVVAYADHPGDQNLAGLEARAFQCRFDSLEVPEPGGDGALKKAMSRFGESDPANVMVVGFTRDGQKAQADGHHFLDIGQLRKHCYGRPI